MDQFVMPGGDSHRWVLASTDIERLRNLKLKFLEIAEMLSDFLQEFI